MSGTIGSRPHWQGGAVVGRFLQGLGAVHLSSIGSPGPGGAGLRHRSEGLPAMDRIPDVMGVIPGETWRSLNS